MARANKAEGFVLASLVAATLLLTPTVTFAQSKSSAKSVDSLRSLIKETTKLRDQVQGAIDSLSALTSGEGAKLPKHFKAYSKHVRKMAKTQKATRKRIADLQASREDYLQDWNRQLESVNNAEVKANMQERQQEVRKTLESARPAGEAALEAFSPFLSDLQDIQRMLSLDLSQSGVTAAAPIAAKAIGEGNPTTAGLDALITALTEIKTQVSPTGK